MKRRTIILSLILLLGIPSSAQGLRIPVTGSSDSSGLYLNIDRIWAYNLYEHSRWGIGLNYRQLYGSGNSIDIGGYAGYGVRDRVPKGGLALAYFFGDDAFYLMASRDYTAAASRRMESTRLQDISDLSGFMSSRMSDDVSFTAGYLKGWERSNISLDARLFFGGRLFDAYGFLYRCNGDVISPENGLQLTLSFAFENSFKTKLVVGRIWPVVKPLASFLSQYSETFVTRSFRTDIFVQGGITPPGVPYIGMFDLGGTFGAPVWFRNVLQTVRPSEYTANAFILLSMRCGLRKPLFDVYNSLLVVGSRPRPFVGFSAAWGHMWGQDADGCLSYEGLDLTSPTRGLFEATAGFDGLLRWGSVDYGIAASVGLHPRTTPSGTPFPRWALLLTAELSL